jgi:hypothetical protein
MSKKIVRVRKSYVKQWIAVISGSLFASSMQAAHAAPGDDRPSFREFRDSNRGIDRQALRSMFRQEFGRARDAANHADRTPVLNNPAVTHTSTLSNITPTVRPDRLTRRLERNDGIINQSVQGDNGNLVSLRS